MPSLKITQLTEQTVPGASDPLAIVDLSGTPTTKKITVTNLTAGKVTKNADIVAGSNKTKVSYDAKGLITSGTDANLDDLGDVILATPTTDQILKFNGTEWVNGASSTVSGSSGIEFYLDDTVILPTGTNNDLEIVTLSRTPVTSAEVVDTIALNSNTVLGEGYLYDTALGTTSITAGAWEFDFYLAVNNAGGVTTANFRVARVRDEAGTVTITGTGTSRTATASTGTPFAVTKIDVGGTIVTDSYLRTTSGAYRITARTSDTVVTITTPTTLNNATTPSAFSVHKALFIVNSPEINNTATSPLFAGLQLYSVVSVQPAYTILTTDKLAIAVAGTSDTNGRSVYFSHNGTTRYSHIHTPMATSHNDLLGLQGGATTERYHLTSAQHTKVTTSNTVNNVLLGNTTSAPLEVAPSTSGNVLTSNGTTWVSSPAPVSVSVTTKGDIQTHNATVPARLAAGVTNGMLLSVDSGETTGLKWITAPGSSSLISNETPTGTIDGSNTSYTLAGTMVSGSLKVFLNGVRMKGGGTDYTEGTNAFTMTVAPLTGDILLVDYYSSTTTFAQGGTNFIDNEPSGVTPDGVETVFSTGQTYIGGTLKVYRDGQRLTLTDDYAETTPGSGVYTFVTAPVTGSTITTDYQHLAASDGVADLLDGYHADATPTANKIPVLDANAKVPQDALYLNNSMAYQSIQNGNFDIWQRGTSFTNITNAIFTTDRWYHNIVLDGGTNPTTIIYSKQNLTSGNIFNSSYFYRVNPNGAGSGYGSVAYNNINQRIEHGTRYLCGAGKTITMSFWAKSDIAGKKIAIWAGQSYGTGGSPSTFDVMTPVGTREWTLTSTWTRYTATFNTATLVGKTFGTNPDDFVQVALYYQWGSTFFSGAETFGGSGNIDISQIQVCSGSVALPFQPKSYVEELALCQRYYFASMPDNSASSAFFVKAANNDCAGFAGFPVTMRIAPTNVHVWNGATVDGVFGFSSGAIAPTVTAAATANGIYQINKVGGFTTEVYGALFHYKADAEL
jgi:hypothetical protein